MKERTLSCSGLYTLLFCVFCLHLNAMAASDKPIRFSRISFKEGLSQNSVFSIYQDRHGFLWFGTLGGLNKYDGYEIELFQNDPSDSLSINSMRIYDIAEDKEGTLWVATFSGVHRYDEKSNAFIQHPDLAQTIVNYLLPDSFGHFWAGSDQGLYRYHDSQDHYIHYPEVRSADSREDQRIYALFEDQHHILWVGSHAGVSLFDVKKKKYVAPYPCLKLLENSVVRTIAEDKLGNLWIGTEGQGAFYINQSRTEIHRLKQAGKNGLPGNRVRTIFPADSGDVWIGTRDGLCIYNVINQEYRVLQYNKYDPYSLSHNSVRNIYQDRAGSIWLGTYSGGVNVVHPNHNFNHYGESMGDLPGLNHPVVSSVVEDASGHLWMGTEGGGINCLNTATRHYQYITPSGRQDSLPHDNVKTLLLDAQDNLWVGTVQGLHYFDRKQHLFHHYTHDPNDPNSLSSDEVYCLANAKEGGLWIGTNVAGLNHLSPATGTIVHYQAGATDSSLSSNNIRALLPEENGDLWIGTGFGLNYLDIKKRKISKYVFSRTGSTSLNNSSVNALYKDRFGVVWIGTSGGGINLLDTRHHRFHYIEKEQGLSGNNIYGIVEDEQGNIWASTNHGLSKVTLPGRKKGVDLSGLAIVNYDWQDGIRTEQFSIGAFCKGASGTYYFGGINGVTYFKPQEIFKNIIPPPIAFTGLEIMNHPVLPGKNSPLPVPINETDEITLTYDQAFFSLTFAALNYISPGKNTYAYKLEGLPHENTWHDLGNKRTITYNKLAPGTYVLKVKATNNDGVWNPQGRALTIHVLPPWWKTTWAYGSYALLLTALLYLFYAYSLKIAKLKHKLSYEALIREKEQELYQRKLQFFTNISHEIKTPLTLILAPIEKLITLDEGNNRIHNQLMMMQRNGERLLRLMNQLLDFRKFETGHVQLQAAAGNVVRFMREISLSFEHYAVHKNITFNFVTPEDTITLWFDRDKLEKIVFNLLSNAFKFTPQYGHIQLAIKVKEEPQYKKSWFLIQITDNRKGIPEEKRKVIFERFQHNSHGEGTGIGLSYTKGLVALHGGTITVESSVATSNQPGTTCFTVALPMGKSHLRQDQIIADFRNSDDIRQYFDKPALERKEEPVAKQAGKRPLLLIIEDQDDLRNYLSHHFQQHYKVLVAADGEEGRYMAGKHIPDIIISDVMMPHKDGIALCKELKSDVHTSHIPIILLTARTPLIFKIEGFETGADDYITKPFSLQMLETRVKNLVVSRARLRERFKTEISLQPTHVAITSPDEQFLHKVLAYLEENIADVDLRVEDIGRAVGMSRTHLYRKVKALTNMGMAELIRNVRLKRAAQLIEQHKININEVAYQVGFQDVDYFRKCFKNQFGVTPSYYQKNYVHH